MYRWVILFLMWVSLVLWVKYVIPLFTEKSGMQSRAAKLSIKRCIWLKLEAKDAWFFFKSKVSSYYTIKGYDNTVPARQVNKHNIKPVNSDFMILFYLCLRKCDFELPRFDTVAYGRHSLHYQGPFIWSKVSSELRNLTSLKAFRKHIRGVNLLSHVDNNSNCCDLCKFWVVYICI